VNGDGKLAAFPDLRNGNATFAGFVRESGVGVCGDSARGFELVGGVRSAESYEA
jgi:hypothetical protein